MKAVGGCGIKPTPTKHLQCRCLWVRTRGSLGRVRGSPGGTGVWEYDKRSQTNTGPSRQSSAETREGEVLAAEEGGGGSQSYMVFRQSGGSRRLWQRSTVSLQQNKHCQTTWSKKRLSYIQQKATFWSIKKSASGEPILDLSEWFSRWLFQWSIWSNDSNFQAFCQLTENEHQTSDYMPEVTYWIKQ